MSDCAVCIGGESDGNMDFSSSRTVKANKNHRCSECRRDILIGQNYHYAAFKFDGDFSTEKCCLECYEIRASFSCGNAYFIGELWSDMQENVFPVMALGCFERLSSPEAKTFLRERWMNWKGLLT